MTIWAASPLLFLLTPTCFGLCERPPGTIAFARHVGMLWLAVGIGGLLFRTGQLFLQQNWKVGLVWATKIVTDPFHDIKLYHRAPLELLRRRNLHDAEAHVMPR